MNGIFDFSTGYKKCLIVGVDKTMTQPIVDRLQEKLAKMLRPIEVVIVPGLNGAYGVKA